MEKFRAKQAVLLAWFKAKDVTVLKVSKTFEMYGLLVILHSAHQNSVFQHYYQSYCNYLLKMGCMNEEQAVFEQ